MQLAVAELRALEGRCLARAQTRQLGMGGCDPVEGVGAPTCQQCMDYGADAVTECVYSGCKWRNYESDCVEGRDRLKVATGMWMVSTGWLMLVWVGGWARRNCGKVEKLRRSGRRLQAEALGKRHDQRTVISGGWPVKAQVYSVRIRCPSATPNGGFVNREVTVTRENYESIEDGGTVEVVVDAGDERVILAASVVDADRERFGWIVLSIAGAGLVPALLFGGLAMMLDAYHCWIPPSCCDEADPNNVSDTPCDGVGGRSHWALCEAPCDQGWMTWIMMSSMFGIMMSFMIVLLRSGSGVSSDDDDPGCSWSKAGNYCFGRGEFCNEEDPNLVALEIIKPQRPTRPGRDSHESSHVPNISRGVTMLDRTFRGITGGARHYAEQPLTEEEIQAAEEELQREELQREELQRRQQEKEEEERRQQAAQTEPDAYSERQQLVDDDGIHDDGAGQEEGGWDEVHLRDGQQVTWADDSEPYSVNTNLLESEGSARDLAVPLPTYQA